MTSGVPLGPLVPLFTFAKTQSHADILVTPMEQWQPVYDLIYEPPWEQKSKSSLFWRGKLSRLIMAQIRIRNADFEG